VALGRQPNFQNGPRLIDMDLLFYDQIILNTPVLTVPHPRMHERGFVLLPLMDIAPELIHPVLKKSVREMTSSASLEGIIQVQ
jgi:2-amino-4-hydroxy-6-hydroxymethyldihydropteridine diphosphokinase